MEETAFIDKLLLFGLSRQEAAIYLCLLQGGGMNGYEAAKRTQISRSNVYNGLAALVEQGAAYIQEGASVRYVAVKLQEFCDNRIRRLEEAKRFLEENDPGPTAVPQGYITVEGYSHICDKIHHLILGAEKRIYFSASGRFLELWHDEIKELVRRGCKVVLISKDAAALFAGEEALRAGILFYEVLPEMARGRENQLRLIIDSEYVLTGETAGTGRDTCLYSAQKNFVNVFKDAMHNEIELIRLKSEQREIGEGVF